MFNIFRSFKNDTFLGIDFGTSSIKIIELKINNQKPELVNYGWVEYAFDKVIGSGVKMEYFDDKPKKYLRALVGKIKPKTDMAYASIPSFNGLVTLIEFPNMRKDELAEAIGFEAHKYIPSSLDDVAISWDLVSRPEDLLSGNSGGAGINKIQVLLVAAPRDKVTKYENLVTSARLKIKATELETFALARSIVSDDPGTHVVVDIGFSTTTIVLVEKGTPKVNRSIDVGGGDITNSIAENLNISKDRAEIIKKQGKNLINGQESAIVLPALGLITGEVSRIISTYKNKTAGNKIDSIIMSGGSSKMTGINEYFFKALQVETITGNPWKKIVYNEKLEQIVKKIGASFAVSIGLALRGVEEFKKG